MNSVLYCLPPALDPATPPFVPEPGRIRAAARLRLAIVRAQEAGRAAVADYGTEGLTAPETAARAAAAGIGRAVVYPGPFDAPAAERLVSALRSAGIAAEMAASTSVLGLAADRESAPERAPYGPIPQGFDGRPPPAPLARDEEDALAILRPEEPAEADIAEALAAARRIGGDRLRLAFDPPRSPPLDPAVRGAWRTRVGLDDPDLAARIDRVLSAVAPWRRRSLARALADAGVGRDRLLAAYAAEPALDAEAEDFAAGFAELAEAYPEVVPYEEFFRNGGDGRLLAAAANRARALAIDRAAVRPLSLSSASAFAAEFSSSPPAPAAGRLLLVPLLREGAAPALAAALAATEGLGEQDPLVPVFFAPTDACAIPRVAPPAADRAARAAWATLLLRRRPTRRLAADAAARRS